MSEVATVTVPAAGALPPAAPRPAGAGAAVGEEPPNELAVFASLLAAALTPSVRLPGAEAEAAPADGGTAGEETAGGETADRADTPPPVTLPLGVVPGLVGSVGAPTTAAAPAAEAAAEVVTVTEAATGAPTPTTTPSAEAAAPAPDATTDADLAGATTEPTAPPRSPRAAEVASVAARADAPAARPETLPGPAAQASPRAHAVARSGEHPAEAPRPTSGVTPGESRPDVASPAAVPAPTAQAPTGTPAAPHPVASSTLVDRVLEVLDRLELAPPPRRMTIELPDADGLRLHVSLRGSEVHVAAQAGGSASPDLSGWGRDLSAGLAARGFDLASFSDGARGEGSGDAHRDADDRHAPAPPRGPARGRRPSTVPDAGLRL